MSPGTKLGSYEILGPLGKGGMGEVHRAQDTRLEREVAINPSGRDEFNRIRLRRGRIGW